MENIPKSSDLLEIDDAAKRQYIDSISVFRAWEEASKAVGEVRGGMYWKRTGQTEYLIRTSPSNSQKALGLNRQKQRPSIKISSPENLRWNSG